MSVRSPQESLVWRSGISAYGASTNHFQAGRTPRHERLAPLVQQVRIEGQQIEAEDIQGVLDLAELVGRV